ncbi:DNA cytosine methyltransferase [Sphingomonas nostoxanthinifaciens]|uniref:DNA cytosine methyltransferase n=1 Tax=Sphingomonas nostoxanthinifaciens TaxID=2872652 RepID=UPI001CC1E5DC|nr:DNA (cytosine-5-)-methyltransferase [Sphingomonas nostoxanthinifaciens]UAK24378.1 DNA cytosine methyltransferase [Sphingomonas nostoxanthinifaciens]
MPTAVSLFSGCGGSDDGLRAAGFDVLMANDVLAYARDLYTENFGGTEYVLKDIRQIKHFPSADLLIGCYPCQGFSQAGVRQPDRNINFLYREFVRALRLIKPKAFVVENVSGMVREDNFHLFQNQVVRFRTSGYRVRSAILDARHFGVAQERRRLFFVGIRSDLGETYEFPHPTHRLPGEEPSSLPQCPTIKDAIGDLPAWPEGEIDVQPFHWYYLSRNRYRGWDEQSKTIVASSRHAPLHPSSPKLLRVHTDKWIFESDAPARRISYREAARLQGFGDLRFPETQGIASRYRVIGNAVPPPVFKAVAAALPDVW